MLGMDAGQISVLLISLTSLLGWVITQTQARSRATRKELRNRRHTDLLKDRYIYRLEQVLASHDLPLPGKPEGWNDIEEHW